MSYDVSYDVIKHAETIALEADFRARWKADRDRMWADILEELPGDRLRIPYRPIEYGQRVLLYPLFNEHGYKVASVGVPLRLAWWRRLAIRLLGGQP